MSSDVFHIHKHGLSYGTANSKIMTVLVFHLTITRPDLSDVATLSGRIVQSLPLATQYISTSESIVWL